MTEPTPFVYLAQAIDFCRVDHPSFYRGILRDVGLAAYVPRDAFVLPTGAVPSPVINTVNRTALGQCEGLVAFLPPEGTASFGVPMEIEQALAEDKPICLVGDAEVFQRSWALASDSRSVFFTEKFTEIEARRLLGMIKLSRKAGSRPRPTRAMFVRADPGATLPTRAYDGDAGFDLYTYGGPYLLEPGENYDIPCGVSVQLPDDVWAIITGRSSTVRKHRLLVTTGIIDSGYRGPLYANVQNLGPDVFEIKPNARIAQMIPFPLTSAGLRPVKVDVLAESDRGEAGFGSSGA